MAAWRGLRGMLATNLKTFTYKYTLTVLRITALPSPAGRSVLRDKPAIRMLWRGYCVNLIYAYAFLIILADYDFAVFHLWLWLTQKQYNKEPENLPIYAPKRIKDSRLNTVIIA